MRTALATTNLPNSTMISVRLTIGQIRLLEAAMFDRGIMSSADVYDGRKSAEAHRELQDAMTELHIQFDNAVRNA
jgi:hypothetical protein